MRQSGYWLTVLLCTLFVSESQSTDIPTLPAEVALVKARCGGRYSMLLHQSYAPNDLQRFGACYHRGHEKDGSFQQQPGSPAGHYVYVYPYWYIWGHDASQQQPTKRRWGCEQVLGKPDTDQAGDIPTAWASKTPDDQDEWLVLEYDRPVVPEEIEIHETYNPGAVVRVTAFTLQGEEKEIWKGRDPTPFDAARGISRIRPHVVLKTNRIKIYLASRSIQGWNEIDAVGLRDSGGRVQWAKAAQASSTYADQLVATPQVAAQPAPQIKAANQRE